MTPSEKFRAWLVANRTSARMAFLLRTSTMALGALLSIIWSRLLLNALGAAVLGNWFLFQRALRIAGLGDFGLSGGLAVRAGQLIGRGDDKRLELFLASARSVMLLMGALLGITFCALSPWIPGWLKMQPIPGTGSLTFLFLIGGAILAIGFFAGYFNSLNAAYATVTWPILPLFFIGQLVAIAQLFLARAGVPLWGQASVSLAASIIQMGLLCWMLRAAHPWLGNLLPLGRDMHLWRDLLSASGWLYLYSLGSVIYTATDSFLINAGSGSDFGPAGVTRFQLNYRLIELAIQVIGSASVIGQSKINLWIQSPEPELQERARATAQRLCLFQSWFGTCAALGYLAINNLFIRHVYGETMRVPSAWQWMFALNLAVTLGGDASIQIAGLCGKNGLRTAGLAIALTGILNLVLSFAAMKLGSVTGITGATVLAQTVLSFFLGWHTCRHLKLPLIPWLCRSCLLPLLFVSMGAVLHWQIGSTTFVQAGLLLAVFVPFALLHGWIAGMNREFIRHELSILRSFWPK